MRIVVLITVALLFIVVRYDANAQTANPERDQIAALKRESSQLKEDLAELKEDVVRLKQIHTEDNARAKERQTELADDYKDIKPFAENWKFFLASIIGVGGIWALWTYFKTIPALVKKEYEARISGLFNEKAEDFHALLGTYDIDKTVKKKYKIVLLSHKDDGFHLKLLQDNGFDVSYHPRIASLVRFPV